MPNVKQHGCTSMRETTSNFGHIYLFRFEYIVNGSIRGDRANIGDIVLRGVRDTPYNAGGLRLSSSSSCSITFNTTFTYHLFYSAVASYLSIGGHDNIYTIQGSRKRTLARCVS